MTNSNNMDFNDNSPVDGEMFMSPLADPVVSAVFSNAQTAGLAAASLIKAVLAEDGEVLNMKEIVSITPQSWHNIPGKRGCRVDIEIVTEDNSYIVVEVQMNNDENLISRNLIAASYIFTDTSSPGTKISELTKHMPRVIVINILNYLVRRNNGEIVQPVRLMYTKPPHDTVSDRLTVYNVQLPAVKKLEKNFNSPCFCWVYALLTAHEQKKNLKEVIKMTPELQEFKEIDMGFKQFNDLLEACAADSGVRKQYLSYVDWALHEEGVMSAALREGHEEGREEGHEDVAFNLLAKGFSVEMIEDVTGVPREKIEAVMHNEVRV